ncbi:MAG: sigma 54-interacting transcriptional regulator [Proteobacteria bacterium]|nr:sigma 54-interacting transcriptional regulator [Pseudomonadota bacterium]
MDSSSTLATEMFTDAATGELRRRRFNFSVVSGPDAGRTFPLEPGTTLIGTHPNNDVVLQDSTVSRYHLELQVRQDGLKITDLETTNGTRQAGPHSSMKIGSIVVTGSTRLRLGLNTVAELDPIDEAVELGEFRSDRFANALGAAPVMRSLFALLSRIAPTDATVLLEGETGSGKEVIAEAVHQRSQRHDRPFVVVDCSSIPHELIASELFGHVRGAYTGALTDKIGLIESASGGTLFLDEIGELQIDLQPQLLRVLEKRQVRRVGETRAIPVDIRVVAATHRDLRKMVKTGKFREDLYYRLAVIRALVPPLRERIEDIPLLASHFAESLGRDTFDLSPALLDQLSRHNWPGNVRELRNVVERALSLGLTNLRLSGGEPDTVATPPPAPPRRRPTTSSELLETPFKEAKSQIIESFERDYLTHLLDKYRGNISRAAQAAGIDRNYIHRLVKKYNIPVSRG